MGGYNPLKIGTWVLTRDTTVIEYFHYDLLTVHIIYNVYLAAELQQLLRTAILPRTISMTFPTRDHTHQSILANIQGMQHLMHVATVQVKVHHTSF